MRMFVLAALAGAVALSATGAHADPCSEMWFARNQIYKLNGYCFKTTRAIQTFGNAGCQYDDARNLPLTSSDRLVVRRIVKNEADMGCRE